MKPQHMQAMFVRRREQEHQRLERTQAVSRYYDHWGKVTSRYQSWTTPEYYKQAEEQVRQRTEHREKQKTLTERRTRLRQLLADEKSHYEQEQKERAKPRARKVDADTETLQKIDAQLKQRENIKRQLALEAKLYGKWRHGVDDDLVLLESRTDNEALAKLNWLDKQVEDQLQREKEQVAAEERKLRMQEELTKLEQTQKERQLIREQEIKEIRALQETHMGELKQCQAESDELKEQEKMIRSYLEELEKETALLEESAAVSKLPGDLTGAYNIKKIKVYIRQRSDVFRNQIKLMLSVLERLSAFCIKQERLKELTKNFEDDLELELSTQAQIDSMYESEAKASLQCCEELWQKQQQQRYEELRQLLMDEKCVLGAVLEDNVERQAEFVELRGTHLNSIESSNEKLKQLIKEQEDSPRGNYEELKEAVLAETASVAASDACSIPKSISARRMRNDSYLPKVTNSFNNLNLDVWQDMVSAPGGIDSPRLQSTRSLSVVTPDTAERPKFARKRVAWN